MDLVLNNLQRLIYHKTQPTNQPTIKFHYNVSGILFIFFIVFIFFFYVFFFFFCFFFGRLRIIFEAYLKKN